MALTRNYRKAFSDWFRGKYKTVKIPSRDTIFDYWLDIRSNKFESLNHKKGGGGLGGADESWADDGSLVIEVSSVSASMCNQDHIH